MISVDEDINKEWPKDWGHWLLWTYSRRIIIAGRGKCECRSGKNEDGAARLGTYTNQLTNWTSDSESSPACPACRSIYSTNWIRIREREKLRSCSAWNYGLFPIFGGGVEEWCPQVTWTIKDTHRRKWRVKGDDPHLMRELRKAKACCDRVIDQQYEEIEIDRVR